MFVLLIDTCNGIQGMMMATIENSMPLKIFVSIH
jgi:hypothetical protein